MMAALKAYMQNHLTWLATLLLLVNANASAESNEWQAQRQSLLEQIIASRESELANLQRAANLQQVVTELTEQIEQLENQSLALELRLLNSDLAFARLRNSPASRDVSPGHRTVYNITNLPDIGDNLLSDEGNVAAVRPAEVEFYLSPEASEEQRLSARVDQLMGRSP